MKSRKEKKLFGHKVCSAICTQFFMISTIYDSDALSFLSDFDSSCWMNVEAYLCFNHEDTTQCHPQLVISTGIFHFQTIIIVSSKLPTRIKPCLGLVRRFSTLTSDLVRRNAASFGSSSLVMFSDLLNPVVLFGP